MIWDIILCSLGTIFVIHSLKKIFDNRSNSLGDYIMVVIYIFNCFPILLNLVFGLPDYTSQEWFRPFMIAAQNETVNKVYAIYIICVMTVLRIYLYKTRHRKAYNAKYIQSKSRLLTGNRLLCISTFPIIFAVMFGHYESYLVFQSALSRGLTSLQYSLLVVAEYIGLFSFFCWFFEYKENKKNHSYLLVLAYCMVIMWIDGKRFMIPTMIMLFIYFYSHSMYSTYKKIPLKSIMIIIAVMFGMLYISYALMYRISSGGSNGMIDALYLSFRIDFGRDDVTKFVLYREIIENNPILEYRGETILSTFLFFVPRSIWPNKPFPHYRYLTAALYNTGLLSIPAGMTPSIFEMNIANFGVVFGIAITCCFFPIALRIADKEKSVTLKAIYLVLMIGLLTQSMDAMIAVIFLAVANKFFQKVGFNGHKII